MKLRDLFNLKRQGPPALGAGIKEMTITVKSPDGTVKAFRKTVKGREVEKIDK